MKKFRELMVAAATIAMAGTAAATVPPACLVDESTNALSVQKDSGEIGFNCSRLHTPDGRQLVDLLARGQALIKRPDERNPNKFDWEAAVEDSDADGIADQTYAVYWVSAQSGLGRCNYTYDGATPGGEGLGAPGGPALFAGVSRFKRSLSRETVFVCGDPEPVPVESEIITTFENECDAEITFDDGVTTQSKTDDLTFGFSIRRAETAQDSIAACSQSTPEMVEMDLGQRECIPPDDYVLKEPDESCVMYEDGSLSLGCARVDITAAPPAGPEYCWYYQNRVCESGNLLAYCDETRVLDSYFPNTQIGAFEVKVDVTEGSTCYTYFLRGRAYFSCF